MSGMTTETQPALTPEEWAKKEAHRPSLFGDTPAELYLTDDGAGVGIMDLDGGASTGSAVSRAGGGHALAALALYDQPFGFTRQDADDLSEVAFVLETPADSHGSGGEDNSDYADTIRRIAAKIVALLPPE